MLRTLPFPLRLLLALVLATMLLARGWMGQAMAMDMVMPAAVAQAGLHAGHGAPAADASGLADHNTMAAAEPAPCHGSADTVALAPAAPADATHDTSHCSTCTLCQVCHSVAMTDAASSRHAFALPQAAPESTAQRFASAEPEPGLKPPIS